MNDQFPRPSHDPSDDDHILFGQLEDLGADTFAEEAEEELEYKKHQRNDRILQRTVAEVIARQECIPDEMTVAVSALRDNPDLEAYDEAMRMMTIRKMLSQDEAIRLEQPERIFTYIWKLGAVVEGFLLAKEVQVEIIDDANLDFEIKRSFLTALDDIASEGKLDIEDIDVVHEALANLYDERVNKELLRQQGEEARQLIRKKEQELLTTYAVHPDDPAWSYLRSAGISIVTLRKRGIPVGIPHGVDEHLNTLRIPYEAYESFINELLR